ncbi:unnamed protein product [Phaedon cochleariae]|uniref:CRAL-TRIO domain-containing protein n=1 Tax=Phaedon cochleariae TaxID=80249 RepID=A0A9P0DKE7_PHACE|nr:unnamed protein product [Phaedon cochleariae]
MDTKEWLTHNKSEMLKVALRMHGKTEEQLEEDIQIIRDWLKTQPHLPEIPCDNLIMNFLLLHKFSIENTKEKLDMYYTIRHLLPEVYDSRANTAEDMKENADICHFIPLPKRTEDGDRVSVVQLTEGSGDMFDMYRSMGYCYNTLEIRLQEDVLTSDIFINDLRYVRMSHIVKITPIHLKKVITILEKVYNNKVKQFHFLNCPPYALTLLNIFKQFMKPKLAARLFIYEDTTSITKHISKDILPCDFGGNERSLYELNEIWKHKLSEYNDRFIALSKMRTDEKLRPSPLKNDQILGYHGNFKKLEMD